MSNLPIGSDPTTAVNSAATIRELYFFARGRCLLIVVIVVVVVERYAVVVTLDQPSTGCVVLGCGQRQSRVLGKWVHGLYQTFTEGALANDEAPIMILNSSAH